MSVITPVPFDAYPGMVYRSPMPFARFDRNQTALAEFLQAGVSVQFFRWVGGRFDGWDDSSGGSGIRLAGLMGNRKKNHKFGSLVRLTLHPDFSPNQLDQFPGQGQANATALVVLWMRMGSLVKPVKHKRQVGFRDSNACIFHPDLKLIPFISSNYPGFHRYRPPGGCKFNGI